MGARRVLDRGDTRPLDHDGQVSAPVVGGAKAPRSGTRAVAIRVVADSARKAGRVTAWPCGARGRDQVAVTYPVDGSSAGLATLPVPANGRLCFGATTSLSALSVDLLGYYTASGVGTKSLRAVATRRMVNSETGLGWSQGRLAAGEPRTVRIAGREGVPADARTVLVSIGLATPARTRQ